MADLKAEVKIVGLRASIFLFYLLLACALTYPAWQSMGTRVIGHPDSDIWKHLWGDIWFLNEWGKTWPIPLETRLIAYPNGGLLYNLDPLTGIFVALMAPFMGVVMAHNLSTVLALAAGGTAAFLLSRLLTGNRGASIVAGAIYAFSAQMLCLALESGIGETVHIAFLPLSIWATLRLMAERTVIWIPILALSLVFSALGSWYYGLVSGIGVLVAIFYYALGAGFIGRPKWGQQTFDIITPAGQRAALLLFATAGLTALMIYPFAHAFSLSISDAQALNSAASVGVHSQDLLPSRNGAVISLRDLFIPGEPRLNLIRDLLLFSNHPGFIPGLLVLVAILLRQQVATGLAMVGIAFLMIGFGPIIHLDRVTPLIPNPIFHLFEAIPVFKAARNLERFQLPFTLCFALASAYGLNAIYRRLTLPTIFYIPLGVLISLLVVVDYIYVSGLNFPLHSADASVPAIYEYMAKEEGEFAIIELPLTDRPGGHPFWYQGTHGRGIPVNLEGVLAPDLHENSLMLQLIVPDSTRQYTGKKQAPTATLAQMKRGADQLVGLGFRYIILGQRSDRQDTDEELRLREILYDVVGAPIHAELKTGIEIYALDPSVRKRP